MLSSHDTLCTAMQVGCMVEWMHDLRPVFEVHRGKEWELMDLCFMTCFTGTLPFSVTLALLWFIPQIWILFIQSRQPCIFHPSPSMLLLCLSWFLFFCLCLYVVSSLLSRSPSPVYLLHSSWRRKCSPFTLWRCHSCLNKDHYDFCLHALTSLLHYAVKKLLFPQCSWWRGQSLCSTLNGGLSTCWGQITAYISVH